MKQVVFARVVSTAIVLVTLASSMSLSDLDLEGIVRCVDCGCKYWENLTCIDCGHKYNEQLQE